MAPRPIPCRCRKCKGALRHPQTAKRHIEDQELEDEKLQLAHGRHDSTYQTRDSLLINNGTPSSSYPSNIPDNISNTIPHDAYDFSEDLRDGTTPSFERDDPIEKMSPPSASRNRSPSDDIEDENELTSLFCNLAGEPAKETEAMSDDDDLLHSDEELDIRNPEDRENPLNNDSNADYDPNDAEVIDIEHDNLFQTRTALFDNNTCDDEQSVHHDGSSDTALPPAFDEDPIIRNIYIRTFVQSAFKGITQDAVHDSLVSQKSTLLALQDRTGVDLHLDKMATTLRTIERRLGVEVDDYITYYFICPECWARHHPRSLDELDSPACKTDGCEGILYTTNGKRIAGPTRSEKRTPTKILPYASLEKYIRRMLLRPGKAEEVEHWRSEDDTAPQEPLPVEEWSRMMDPDRPMLDIHDGASWRSLAAGLSRHIEMRSKTAFDVDTENFNLRFVSLRYGLLLTMNIDWFQPMATRTHSTGAIYFTVNNLPRGIRNLRENTFLVCVIPGPNEPSKEQMNIILELITAELKDLGDGVGMPIRQSDGSTQNETTYTMLQINCSDSPARAKTNGTASCTCHGHMCTDCTATLPSLVDPRTFDPELFESRDRFTQLFWKLIARDASAERRELIFNRKGVRFSSLDELSNWFAARCSPPDPMHTVLIGIMGHIHKHILSDGGLFNAYCSRPTEEQPFNKFQALLQKAWWPSWVARVPAKVHKGSGKVKADQWRNLIPIYAIALFDAFREGDSTIVLDKDAPSAAKNTSVTAAQKKSNKLTQTRRLKHIQTNNNEYDTDELENVLEEAEITTASRNYRQHYEAVCNFLAGSSILLKQSITLNEAKRSENYFGRSFRLFAEMGCHLTPNFHVAMHLYSYVELYGPVYGWWVYAFERMNGILSRFKTNGHVGGELEATILRGWVKSIRIQELLSYMQEIPEEERTPDDVCTINCLLDAVAGGAEGKRARGTFLSYIAALSSGGGIKEKVTLPKQSEQFNLLKTGLYNKFLTFARQLRPADDIISESIQQARGRPRLFKAAKAYSTAVVDGVKYGCSGHHRGRNACYGYFNGRKAAIIDRILEINIGGDSLLCCILRPFIPAMVDEPPWYKYATDIGIAIWTEEYDTPQIIPITQLSGQFGWVPLIYDGQNVRVTFSLDHRSQEPDVW